VVTWYLNNGNFREYSYFVGDFAVLKREFPVALI